MLLANIVEYYTTNIERNELEVSISGILILSGAGLALVNDSFFRLLMVEASSFADPVSSSGTHNGDTLLYSRHKWCFPCPCPPPGVPGPNDIHFVDHVRSVSSRQCHLCKL